jgi:elongation factor Ts
MTEISAALVKELRESTGAGMMDCKRALVETAGDIEAARKLLREKGMASAGKRAGRDTTEGRVAVRTGATKATIVAVGCETEPVSKNDGFLVFLDKVLDTVDAGGPAAADGLDAERVELVAKIGENIAIRGAVRFEGAAGDVFASYVHPPANKIGVLVHGRGNADTARLLCMHVSFAAPRYLTRDEVPADEVAAEREVLLKRPDVEAKPENVRDKIVDGILAKNFFGQTVLLDQQWIHDTGKNVSQALKEGGFELLGFQRFAVAE